MLTLFDVSARAAQLKFLTPDNRNIRHLVATDR